MRASDLPSIAVVIPAYNAATYLGAALESVFAQTVRPAEIIVVDDGSTDETPSVLETFAGRIRVIRQDNAGEAAARNRGIAQATAQFVAFLDADDVCSARRLEEQATALVRDRDAVVCFTGHWLFDNRGRIGEFEAAAPSTVDPLDFLSRCQYVAASMMFDRSRAQGLRFPEHRRASGCDIVFSALLATRGRVVAVRQPLYGYRSHPAQSSAAYRATATSNWFFEFRYNWAKAHWQEHWPDRGWPEVERKLWEGLVDQTEAAYWARHKAYFLNDRNYMRRQWPGHLPRPAVLNWRWYPDWIWRAKDQFDRRLLKR